LIELASAAAAGDVRARRLAQELEDALMVLSTFDEGPDLVLFYKHLLVLNGDAQYAVHFNESDCLTVSQRGFVEQQYKLFKDWWATWNGASD
jgi:hypothetical protein